MSTGLPDRTSLPGSTGLPDRTGLSESTSLTPATPALQLIDVHKNFGATPIIRGLNLEVRRGERHAVIGPNGAGKSTTFHLVSGRFPVSSGQVLLKGESINGLPPYMINRRGLARSFQVTNIFPRLSVFENIRCGVLWSLGYKYSFWHRVERAHQARERSDAILEQINLSARRDVPAGVLSYAEQRALEIGITIAGGADVIMLDEPTAGMSRSETEHAVALIRKVSEGKTLVIVEHDMSVVFDLADRISVLVYGQVIATDIPERIRGNAAVQEAYLGAHVEESEEPGAGPPIAAGHGPSTGTGSAQGLPESGLSAPSRPASPRGTGGGNSTDEGQT